MKVIFLDIDGVLVTKRSEKYATRARRDHYQKHGEDVPYIERCQLKTDQRCISALNGLTEETGAKIVVSSAWRHGESLAGLRETLGAMGVTGSIVGKTPSGGLEKRGEQIAEWLERTPRQVDAYVVIDDMSIEGHALRFVQTTMEDGLTKERADAARNVLLTQGWERAEVGL